MFDVQVESGCADTIHGCPANGRPGRPVDAPVNPLSRRRYARMFPGLPRFTAEAAFRFALGRQGGICDCGAEHDGPESEANGAAGWAIFGQFIAHDITADRSAPTPRTNVHALENARTPQLDLECLYGDGPVGHPFLFRRDDAAGFLIGDGDLLRNHEGIAIIGDPRNDSHMLISQLHLAMQRVHNAFVSRARRAGVPEAALFEQAQRQTRWHYQWIVVHEFLPAVIGDALASDLAAHGPRYYTPLPVPFIPLEFADAAFRYGHSQIRHLYRANLASEPAPLFPDYLGFRPVPPSRRVDWRLFFDGSDGAGANGAPRAQRARKIDGKMVRALIRLPVELTGEVDVDEYQSLAMRDLERGEGVGLPSGEALARHLGQTPLTREEIGVESTNWQGETPLWFYILREAAARTAGDHLGPVGGRIVGDVLTGLLASDPLSYRNVDPTWRPAYPTLASLLEFGATAR
jgi:Animal haem peroxidase